MTDALALSPTATLLEKIRGKRPEISTYTHPEKFRTTSQTARMGQNFSGELYTQSMEPRRARLTNITIICGAISTALMAASALGGESLTTWLTEAFALIHLSILWVEVRHKSMLCSC